MEQLRFKTNLNCGGCVAKVQEDLNHHPGIESWNVNVENPEKILAVVSKGITAEEIMRMIRTKGFTIERLS